MSTARVSIVNHRNQHLRTAFSLIEILVSILILSLGLLGLGALFPVVIREQRTATDNVLGTIAGNNLRAMIAGELASGAKVTYIQRTTTSGSVEVEARYYGLAALLAGGCPPAMDPDNPSQALAAGNLRNSAGFSLGTARLGMFEPRWNWRASTSNRWGQIAGASNEGLPQGKIDFSAARIGSNPDATFANLNQRLVNWETPFELVPITGRTSSGFAANTDARRVVIPFEPLTIAQRIGPASAETDETPSMVWDIAPRRVFRGEYDAAYAVNRPSLKDDIQLAVFVRRIDQGIRLQPGETLRRKLVNPDASLGNPTILPLGVDAEGRATLDGTDGEGGVRYSWPMEAGDRRDANAAPPDFASIFEFNDSASPAPAGTPESEWRQWLENIDVESPEGEALAQVGQKLIDNLGNVYTVERVEPSVRTGALAGAKRVRLSPAPAADDINVDRTSNRRRLRQFIFTPQVPVAAFTVDVPVKREIIK